MMFENGASVTLGGRSYTMVFTLAAMLQITQKYGDVDGMIAALTGPPIDNAPEDDEETVALKKKQRETASMKGLAEMPWIIATLANQGIMLETGRTDPGNPELLDEGKVALMMMPRDMMAAMEAVMDCIAAGMGTEHSKGAEDAPRDMILEELDRKNAEGAAK